MAVVDIGTNSVLLLVVEADRAGELRPVVDEATGTRLGAGVDERRLLARPAIDRTLDCLKECAARAQAAGAGELRAVATSVLRDAQNGDAFLDEAAPILAARPLVLSGRDEARLTFEGALGGLGLGAGDITVCDLGGGSTELVAGCIDRAGRETVGAMASFELGCVRATERHLHQDPPAADEIERLRDEARARLEPWREPPAARLVAVGGTATSLAAIVGRVVPYDPSRIHGFRLSRATLRRQIEQLARLPVSERRAIAALEPRRADVIVAGALLLDEVAARLGVGELRVSDRGLRWGVAARLVSGRPVAG